MTGARQVLTLTIPGDPLPKERPRSRGGQSRSFTPKRTRDAEKAIAALFVETFPGFVPLDVPITLTASFYRATRRWVDTDNLLKLVTDALNGIAWTDDRLIDDLRGIRHLGIGQSGAHTTLRIGISG